MTDQSKIEWTDTTWNPVTGCTKVSQGCKNCYAKREWSRLSANPKTVYYGRRFEDVMLHPERLGQPLRWKRPRRIFVNSMSDLFHEEIPDEFIAAVFGVMALCAQHTFQVLTKRPERMRAWFRAADTLFAPGAGTAHCIAHLLDSVEHATGRPLNAAATDDLFAIAWPLPNVWLGVSVEDQATADERIPPLLETPAAVRFLSCEPLLGPLDLTPWLRRGDADLREHDPLAAVLLATGEYSGNAWVRPALDWIIAGGESGPGARPMHPDWVRSLRDQCQVAGVPFFFKQWGEWVPHGAGLAIYPDGETSRGRAGCDPERPERKPGRAYVMRVGKKAAGRILDGRTHGEVPG